MVPSESTSNYCSSCALSVQIPDLSVREDRTRWVTLEAAKRHLLFTLDALKLPTGLRPGTRQTRLSFHFLRGTQERPATTGHARGVITVDIAEANPVFRERERERLNEAYRTPLGHLRHEAGHHYFDHVIVGTPLHADFRALFGDERTDYDIALERHYAHGPPADWADAHVSRYATMHPSEDWAETWAHYLHMVDTLETGKSYELSVREPSGGRRAVICAEDSDAFDDLFATWHALALALNGLNRSMGLPDAYPFAISPLAQQKVSFVHRAIRHHRTTAPAS